MKKLLKILIIFSFLSAESLAAAPFLRDTILKVKAIASHFSSSEASDPDTLINHNPAARLQILKYTQSQGWGYVLGHNYLFRQQYAEKYFIEGAARVSGVIAYLEGTYENALNVAEFGVYEVAQNHFPGKLLGSKKVAYQDLSLDATPTSVSMDVPVRDAFFVSFNLLDYAHGGYEGDTIGLYMSASGSRPSSDFSTIARNVVQKHNHAFTEWVDFRTQNFTPHAAHFALYPIITFEEEIPTSTEDPYVEHEGLKLFPAYPNPANHTLHLAYSLTKPSSVSIQIFDLNGLSMIHSLSRAKIAGKQLEQIDISAFPAGVYVFMVSTPEGSLASKFSVIK